MRLSRAMIYVKDLDAMSAFYSDTLGLKPVEETRSDTWAEFKSGGVGVALHVIPPYIADQIEISDPPRARDETPIKLIFEVDDVLSERKRLASRGVALIQRPWGTYDGVDPEGNIFGFHSTRNRE